MSEPTEADWLEGNDPETLRDRFEELTADPGTLAVAFAADLIETLIQDADSVQHPTDGVVRIEVAFDRDGLVEWIVAALAEHGLIPPNPPRMEVDYA